VEAPGEYFLFNSPKGEIIPYSDAFCAE